YMLNWRQPSGDSFDGALCLTLVRTAILLCVILTFHPLEL
ncbi:321_t:CDS:2, partial [Paraglomus brasilianum]